MQKTLIDSGPLIALFDRSDRYHQPVLDCLRSYRGQLISSWCVLTEVSHMLDFSLQAQLDFLDWVERGAIQVQDIAQSELLSIRQMMEKYGNLPMDLADASLLYLANTQDIRQIISIDSDFDVYRTLKKQQLTNLLRSYPTGTP